MKSPIKAIYYSRDEESGAKLIRIKYDTGKIVLTDGFNVNYIEQDREEWFQNVMRNILEEIYDTAYERGKREVQEKIREAFRGIFNEAYSDTFKEYK